MCGTWCDECGPASRSEQDLVNHCIHAAEPALSSTLRRLLGVLHSHKKLTAVDAMLHRVYEPILWRSLRSCTCLHAFPLVSHALMLSHAQDAHRLECLLFLFASRALWVSESAAYCPRVPTVTKRVKSTRVHTCNCSCTNKHQHTQTQHILTARTYHQSCCPLSPDSFPEPNPAPVHALSTHFGSSLTVSHPLTQDMRKCQPDGWITPFFVAGWRTRR